MSVDLYFFVLVGATAGSASGQEDASSYRSDAAVQKTLLCRRCTEAKVDPSRFGALLDDLKDQHGYLGRHFSGATASAGLIGTVPGTAPKPSEQGTR